MTYAGRSISEMLWDELDAELYTLMDLIADGLAEDDPDRARQAGICHGLALAISIWCHPDVRDVNEVKEGAMRRYEARHGKLD